MFNIHHFNTFLFLNKVEGKECVPSTASIVRFSQGGRLGWFEGGCEAENSSGACV